MGRLLNQFSQALTVLLILYLSTVSIVAVEGLNRRNPGSFNLLTSQTSLYSQQQVFPTPGSTRNFSTLAPLASLPSWTNATPIPTPREGYGAAEVNGIFYYIAGYGPTGDSVVNEAYNASSNSWTTKAQLPGSIRSETVAVSDGKYVYLVGGREVPTVGHDLLRYDPANNNWTSLAPMPTARATEHMGVYYSGRIYVMGGRTSGEPTAGGDLSVLEIYNIATNTWTTGSPMLQPLADAYSILLGTKIYVFGGFTATGTASTATYIYDIPSNSWTTGAASPVGTIDPAVGLCGSLIYMIGGSTTTLNLQTSNYVYNPSTDTWNTSIPIPVRTAEVQAISFNQQIYVTSGGIFGSGGGNPTNQVFHCANNRLFVSPPVQSVKPPGTIVTYQIRVASFQPFTSWNISVKTDPTVILPQNISIEGNLFQTNFTSTTLAIIANCVNGVGKNCGPGDGQGVAHSTVSIAGTVAANATLNGLLFTVNYKSIGGTYSPVAIAMSQITDPTGGLSLHATINGIYGKPPPAFQINVQPASIQVGRESSGSSSILVQSLNSFTGNVSVSASVVSSSGNASQSLPGVSISPSSANVAANQTSVTNITVTSHDQVALGNYIITISGNALSKTHSTTLLVAIVPDFSINAAPSSKTAVPGAILLSTITITSKDFCCGITLTQNTLPRSPNVPEVFFNVSFVNLSPGQTVHVAAEIESFISTTPANYTVTVNAASEFSQISHGIVLTLNLLPPVLTISPTTGPIGTRVMVRGSNFPFSPGQSSTSEIDVSFDDSFAGFILTTNSTFTFVLDVPQARQGQHLIRADDTYAGVIAETPFTVTASLTPISLNVQIGTVYFPGETAIITILAAQPGSSTGLQGLSVQAVLSRPDGTNVTLTINQLAPNLFRAKYSIPTTGPIGTYAVLIQAASPGQTSNALQTFEVKLSWLSSNTQNITSAIAAASVVGLVGVALKKGYLGRKKDESDANA